MITPILFLGAGNMGGAIFEGWLKAGAFAAADLMIVDPRPGKAALAARGPPKRRAQSRQGRSRQGEDGDGLA